MKTQFKSADILREQWRTERGQIWRLGVHRLMCGDCAERKDVARLMNGRKATLMFTDPPQGLDITRHDTGHLD